MYYTGERTSLDNQRWHSGLIGKVFSHKCPDNDKYYRSIRVTHNPFTNWQTAEGMGIPIYDPTYGRMPPQVSTVITK